MFHILCLLVLVVFHGARGQDCVPEPVENLRMASNSTLLWSPSTNCEHTSYLIYLIFEDDLEHIYQVDVPWLDVTFLPACELYRFIVVALSDTLIGEGTTIMSPTPAVPEANLTVTHFVATTQTQSSVFLEWELDEKFAHCVQYFRVMHWDGETVPIDTYTTYDNVLIDNLAPCTQYDITVTPIYNDEEEGGVGLVIYDTPAHSLDVPWLDSIRPGSTYADMTWRLPPYTSNRCAISTLILDASPHANLTVPITDTRERLPVPIHVDDLQPDSMYFFRVTMINSAGPSTPVQIGIQTLPEAD